RPRLQSACGRIDEVARNVAAGDVRKHQLDAVQTAPLPDVEVIERAGSHAHDRAVRVRSRIRRFLEPEHAGTTVFMKSNAEHAKTLETRPSLGHARVRD